MGESLAHTGLQGCGVLGKMAEKKSAKLVVPSDIAVCEQKCKIGERTLKLSEWTGLLGVPPMWHIRYSKLDRKDMRAILKNKFDPEDKRAAAEICMRRQDSVSKYVV